MEENTCTMALAGLLHDIGKFAVRAEEHGTRIADNEMTRDSGYYHALLTSDFIEECVPEPWRLPVKNAASRHHRPGDRASRILAVADHLSAGERADPGLDERATQPRRLLSIFCSIKADGVGPPPDAYWPLAPLAVQEKALFPDRPLPDDAVWQEYRRLWDAFVSDAGRLRDAHASDGDLSTYLESLLLLLQRYTWCIPSAYCKTRPDISLYDHGRMTAALAAVLAASDLTEARLEALGQKPKENDEPVALLVGGDLSGLQDFLYTITARGAASALRGRSFYLQLLTEAVARSILRGLSLPLTNLIYAGGGNFYLLARPGDGARLREIQREVSRVLLQQHRGELYVALAERPLSGADFTGGRISAAWRELGEALGGCKQRRFAELGDELARVFEPQGHGGNQEAQCAVCGAEHPGTKVDPKSITETNREGVRKCPQCLSYEELGERLRRARYLALDELVPQPADPGAPPGAWEAVLATLGMRATLAETTAALPRSEGERRVLLALSDNALDDLAPGPRTAIGRRLLVNVTPTITAQEIRRLRENGLSDLPAPDSTKPFHALEAQSHGLKRLGVLRMDVDNLGVLFAEGLGERATLSRIASLSFAISLFFEGWVAELARRQNGNGQERVYSIYSGGDDLFFVGSWDAMPELARAIRADLSRFAAGHPGVHASAGIALVDGKYPLYQAAENAGRAESQAKALRWVSREGNNERQKDAVSFLGQALPWERFGLEACEHAGINTAHALMHLLRNMMEQESGDGKGAPQALLRRLLGLSEQYEEANRKRRKAGEDQTRAGQPQVLWGPWMWRGFYTLTRMADHRKTEAEVRAQIRDLRDQLEKDRFTSMEHIGLAARWAELWLRKE